MAFIFFLNSTKVVKCVRLSYLPGNIFFSLSYLFGQWLTIMQYSDLDFSRQLVSTVPPDAPMTIEPCRYYIVKGPLRPRCIMYKLFQNVKGQSCSRFLPSKISSSSIFFTVFSLLTNLNLNDLEPSHIYSHF